MSCSKHQMMTEHDLPSAKSSKPSTRLETDPGLFTLQPCYATDERKHGVVRIVPSTGIHLKRDQPPLAVLVLDCSGSMNSDGRILEAKRAIKYYCECARNEPGYETLITIVAFNYQSWVVLPPTLNPSSEVVDRACSSIYPEGGTNFESGLRQSVKSLTDERFSMILFFTDGLDDSDLRVRMHDFTSKGTRTELLVALKRQGLVLHTFGIGGNVPMAFLREMAAFPHHKGETTLLSSPELMRAAMGVSLALLHQCVAGRVEVVLKAADGTILERMEVNELQTGVESKSGFVCASTPHTFALEINGATVAEVGDDLAVVDSKCAAEAIDAFQSTRVDRIIEELSTDRNLDAALERVRKDLELLQTVADGRTGSLAGLETQIQGMQLHEHQLSDAPSRVQSNWGDLIQMGAQNAAQMRVVSGAEALIPTMGRTMSDSSRTFSSM